MKHETRNQIIGAALVFLAPATLVAGLVSDPYRAVTNVWPKHVCMGQDYRFLLDPGFLALEDDPTLRDEPFMKEAGVTRLYADAATTGGGRRIEIRKITCRDRNGKVVPCRFQVNSFTRGAKVEKSCGSTVVFAPQYDPFESAKGIMAHIQVAASNVFTTIEIDSPDLDKAQRTRSYPKQAAAVAFDVSTSARRYVVKGLKLDDHVRRRLGRVPFAVYPGHRGMLGLDPKNVDTTYYDKLVEKYGEGYLGADFGEWDAMFFFRLPRHYCAATRNFNAIGTFPCDRAGLRRNLKAYWDLAVSQMGSRVFGMTAAALDSMTVEWGSALCSAELTDNREKAYRTQLMRMRGACRQFDVPMFIYTAYYREQYTCDTRPSAIKASNGTLGPDFGREPSLSLREHYMTYYMGNNYQSFESQPWGQMIKVEEKKVGGESRSREEKSYRLDYTGNGKAMKNIYDWYKSPKGARGESYAPILLLDEGTAGYDNLSFNHIGEKRDGGPWYNSFHANDADFFENYVMEAISPYCDPNVCPPWKFTPDFSSNMRNSTLADVFDVYVATPLDPKREPTYGQLAKYPVVMALHDLRWTETLANTVKRYVANGGTFVATTAQVAPFVDDPDFLGVKSIGPATADGELLVNTVELAGAEVVGRSAEGRPLILKKPYFGGNVILATSPFFRKLKNRDTVPTVLLRLLDRLQAETVPFKVKGLCEAMYNRCADGSWRVVLINNSGAQKQGNKSVAPARPEWDAKLELTIPAGAKAEEIRLGAKLEEVGNEGTFKLTVPVGEVCVVKVDNVKIDNSAVDQLSRPTISSSPKPVPHFGRMPYVAATKDDTYRHVPKAGNVSTPDVIGEWKGSNGFRDSSPQGHDMKFNNGARVVDGQLVADKSGSSGEIRFNCDYAIPEATYDMYVTPAAGAKKGGVFAKATYCGVSDNVRIDIEDGCWVLVVNSDRTRRGPKLEPKRTRLTVTLKDGIVRFYVDGVEVKSPRGPGMLSSTREARDDFYQNVYVYFGASMQYPGWNFPGTCESLKFTSKAIAPTGE